MQPNVGQSRNVMTLWAPAIRESIVLVSFFLSGLALGDVIDELEPGHWAAVSLNTNRRA